MEVNEGILTNLKLIKNMRMEKLWTLFLYQC